MLGIGTILQSIGYKDLWAIFLVETLAARSLDQALDIDPHTPTAPERPWFARESTELRGSRRSKAS
jgi:hypothetical protein